MPGIWSRRVFRPVQSEAPSESVFAPVCVFVVLCGYNRMHMTNHFLPDVCFGKPNTILLTAGICTVFLKAAQDRAVGKS